MADKVYRSVVGSIQFDPKESEAAGKPVRNIVVKATGFKEQAVSVSATVWPEHAGVALKKGDVVFLEGSYTQNKGTKQDGSPVVYHNLSVSRIGVLGAVIEGDKPDVVNQPDEDDVEPDDIPF